MFKKLIAISSCFAIRTCLIMTICCSICHCTETKLLESNNLVNAKLDEIKGKRAQTIILLNTVAQHLDRYIKQLSESAFPSYRSINNINKNFIEYLGKYKQEMEQKCKELLQQNEINNNINVYEYNKLYLELTSECSEYIKNCNNFYKKHYILYSYYKSNFEKLINTLNENIVHFEKALMNINEHNTKLQEKRQALEMNK